jgi:hypothetical protein
MAVVKDRTRKRFLTTALLIFSQQSGFQEQIVLMLYFAQIGDIEETYPKNSQSRRPCCLEHIYVRVGYEQV